MDLKIMHLGWGRCGPSVLSPAPLHLPHQPLHPPAPGRLRYLSICCLWMLMAWPAKPTPLHLLMQSLQSPICTRYLFTFVHASMIFELATLSRAHGRYHRWRKIGAMLQPVRKICPGNNQPWIEKDSNFKFPGREWTASRLKERGKELVVDLQEIVT